MAEAAGQPTPEVGIDYTVDETGGVDVKTKPAKTAPQMPPYTVDAYGNVILPPTKKGITYTPDAGEITVSVKPGKKSSKK